MRKKNTCTDAAYIRHNHVNTLIHAYIQLAGMVPTRSAMWGGYSLANSAMVSAGFGDSGY